MNQLFTSAAFSFAAVLSLATAVTASAQVSAKPAIASDILGIASSDNDCPVEPHPRAIDPAIIECHAKFAPVPVIPIYLDETTADQRTEYGEWLVKQLEQPGVCGADTKVGRFEACAVLIYVLHPNHRAIGAPRAATYDGPWTHVVRIYRVSHPKDPQNAMIEVVTAEDGEDFYGTGRKPIWNLLAEQRAAEECRKVKSRSYTKDNGSGRALPDSCGRTEGDDPRFIPMLLLPRSRAELVLNDTMIRSFFRAPVYYYN